MGINWKVRLKNPAFWTGLIGVLATLAISVAQLLGFDISAVVNEWQAVLIQLATAIFGILGLVGVVTDPTTSGVSDSAQALTYDKPKEG